MGDIKQVLIVGQNPPSWHPRPEQNDCPSAGYHFEGVRTGIEALVALGRRDFVAVIAQAALPGMSGIQLLDEVQRRQPGVIRFVQSDLAEAPDALRCLGRAHHVLLLPTTPDQVVTEIQRILSLEAWLPSVNARHLLTGLTKVPSPPEIYFEIVHALESDSATLEDIGQKISGDPAVTAKLLQLVNSASFGLQITVSSPDDAVAYLGFEMTKSMVLLAHTFSYFDRLPTSTFSIQQLWQHSYATARCAKAIARCESVGPEAAAEAFSAGLLHDLGKLLFAANFGIEFGKAIHLAARESIELWRAEHNVFGVDHAELGASLLMAWGLPSPLIEAVAVHHYPVRISEAGLIPTAAVHVGNVLSQVLGLGMLQPRPSNLDKAFLQNAGLHERLADWTRASMVLSEAGTIAA